MRGAAVGRAPLAFIFGPAAQPALEKTGRLC